MESERGLREGSEATVPSAGGVRQREIILLLILASVQFTSIVDFMVVMPLGPELRLKLGINPAQFGRIVASYTISRRHRGIAGILDHGPVWPQGRLLESVRRVPGGYAAMRAGAAITRCLAARRGHGRVRRDPERSGAHDHRRRIPGGTAGSRDRSPDVGLCARIERGRADRHSTGNQAGLARSLSGAGGPRRPGLFCGAPHHAPLARPSAPGPSCASRSQDHRDLQPAQQPARIRARQCWSCSAGSPSSPTSA